MEIDKELIDEIEKNIGLVKKVLLNKVSIQLGDAADQLLIWGLYMIVAPLLVTIFNNHAFWAYILPLFFVLSMIKLRNKIAVIIYWTIAELIFILGLKLEIYWLFYAGFALIPLAFVILKPRRVHRTSRIISIVNFWVLVLSAGVMLMVVLLKYGNGMYIPLIWPFIITFSLGLLGSFSSKTFFLFGLIGTLAGPAIFLILPQPWKFWVTAFYGVLYASYFFRLKNIMRGLKNEAIGSFDT